MENERTQNKVAMTYGAIYGLASIVVFLLFYFIGTDIQSKAPQYTSYLLLVIFIVMGVKSFRDQDLGGHISYSRSLGTGTLISLYGGIIGGAFSVLFFMFIAPEMTEQIIAAAQEERFTRKKHDPGFPHKAVEYCLQAGKIGLKDVRHLVFYDKPLVKFERLLETYLAFAPRGVQSFVAAMPVWLKEKLLLKSLLQKEFLVHAPEMTTASLPQIQ